MTWHKRVTIFLPWMIAIAIIFSVIFNMVDRVSRHEYEWAKVTSSGIKQRI